MSRILWKFLRTHQETIHMWTESLSHIVQVLALLLAGFWTYKTFWESERPTLEPHLTAFADVTWSELPHTKDRCQGILQLSLENIGKRSVDVTEMTVNGWLADVPESKEMPSFVPDEDLKKGKKFFGRTFTSGYLLGHLPPGVRFEDGFTWEFKNESAKVAIWEVTFNSRESTKYNAEAFISDFVCDYSSNDR